MTRPCKICGQACQPLHVRQNIPFYFCPKCNFLQNFYWENNPSAPQEQIKVNDEMRQRRWPAGKRDYMYNLGWEMLEFMTSPIAWRSRQVHAALKKISGYTAWTKKQAKHKIHRLMDFGCGHGISILEMRRRDGLDAIGVDPYSPTIDPHIIRKSLHDARFPNNSFDGIFSIETLEHIPNVLEEYKELNRILKPGGILLVQTRRLEDPDYKARGANWFYLREPQTHVSIYSERAMQTIAQKNGFREVKFRGVRLAKFTK